MEIRARTTTTLQATILLDRACRLDRLAYELPARCVCRSAELPDPTCTMRQVANLTEEIAQRLQRLDLDRFGEDASRSREAAQRNLDRFRSNVSRAVISNDGWALGGAWVAATDLVRAVRGIAEAVR
jgi:hypothetical protein